MDEVDYVRCHLVVLFSALQRCHQQLHSDLKDKYSALNIDTECIQMNNLSGTVSLHPDPTRIKKG